MKFAVMSLLALSLLSCACLEKQRSLSEIKAGLECVEFREGMKWEEISREFGPADSVPLPEEGTTLENNAWVYRNKIAIFYTELKEIVEGEKTRFQGVVYKTELCRKK